MGGKVASAANYLGPLPSKQNLASTIFIGVDWIVDGAGSFLTTLAAQYRKSIWAYLVPHKEKAAILQIKEDAPYQI